MLHVLIVTGDQDVAFDLEDEIHLIGGESIAVTLVCSNTDPYDPFLEGISLVVSDGTIRTSETHKTHRLAWFNDPVHSALYCRMNPLPVVELPRLNHMSLPDTDVRRTAEEVVHVLSRLSR